MAFKFNGADVDNVTFNGSQAQELQFNGDTVWVRTTIPVWQDGTPPNVSRNTGQAANITAVQESGSPATYQWYSGGGVLIAGQTTTTLTEVIADAGNHTRYCRATNAAGSVNSRTATLTYTVPFTHTLTCGRLNNSSGYKIGFSRSSNYGDIVPNTIAGVAGTIEEFASFTKTSGSVGGDSTGVSNGISAPAGSSIRIERVDNGQVTICDNLANLSWSRSDDLSLGSGVTNLFKDSDLGQQIQLIVTYIP